MKHKSTALQHALQTALLTLTAGAGASAFGTPVEKYTTVPVSVKAPMGPCSEMQAAAPVMVSVGKTMVFRPSSPIDRIVLGNPAGSAGRPAASDVKEAHGAADDKGRPGVGAVDVLLMSKSEVFLVGKSIGSSNVVLHHEDGRCTSFDVAVSMDTASLQGTLARLLPNEHGVQVQAAYDSIVLTGTVSDAVAVGQVLDIANAFARGAGSGEGASVTGANPRIVNMLTTGAPQQVMLEVKVAEVSKSLVNKLGARFAAAHPNGSWSSSVLADFLTGSAGVVSVAKTGAIALGVTLDAEKDDGMVKILAEPTIMAISGQKGTFNAGGKIFIPVAQANQGGGSTITLEEKPFGISVSFVPTVLDGGRINLQVATEVSELDRNGVGITAPGVSGASLLPSFTSRSASTTVQLLDGQSFAIGGLIKSNSTTNIKALPGLGELPILGALFRSTDFETDKTELVFVVTPHLARPLAAVTLPTDAYVQPNRGDVVLGGKLEGQ